MSNTIDFTKRFIDNRLEEANKKKQGTKSTLKESKAIKEAEEIDELDEEGVDPEPEMPEGDIEAPAEEPLKEEGDSFEESETDSVLWCTSCRKHFMATADTPDNEIECPVCGEKDLIVNIGTAEEALDKEENKDIAVEVGDEDVPEEEVPAEEPPVDEGEEFEEDGLEEALSILAQKHLNEKARIRIRQGTVKNDGTLVLEGRILPLKKDVKVVLEGFVAKKGKSRFILEGTTDMFKVGKLKVAIVKEGNKFRVKKMGFGILTESAKYPVSGIIG